MTRGPKPKGMKRRRIYTRGRMEPWGCIKIPMAFGGKEVPLSGEGIGSCGLIVCYPTLKAFRLACPKERPTVYTISRPKEKND